MSPEHILALESCDIGGPGQRDVASVVVVSPMEPTIDLLPLKSSSVPSVLSNFPAQSPSSRVHILVPGPLVHLAAERSCERWVILVDPSRAVAISCTHDTSTAGIPFPL